MSRLLPDVSIIIPAFNAERTMGKCLSAMLNQTISQDRFEVIVVDDGSTDSTRDIARSMNVVLLEEQHAGPALARNRGVEVARGSIVLFTDSDCIAAPDFVEQMLMPFSDPMVVGVKGAYKTRQKQLWARFAQVEFEERYVKLAKADTIDFVDSHAAAFRIDVFREVGGFDPHFPVANNEDVDLSYKIARLGYRMVFNHKAIVFHFHPDSMAKYLRTKFLRAYWRMLVYRRFPEKILSDSYTPQTLKLQIPIVALLCLVFIAAVFNAPVWDLTGYLSLFYLLSITPFLFRTYRHDPRLIWFCVIALFLRSLIFGLGIVTGFLAQRRRDLLIPSLLVTSDAASAITAYLLAFWTRSVLLRHFMRPFDHTLNLYLSIFPLIIVFWFLSFHAVGLYRRSYRGEGIGEFSKVTRAVSMTIFSVIAISFFLKWDYSRGFILLYWIIAIVLCNLARMLVRQLQWHMQRKGYQVLRVIVVGTGGAGQIVVRRITGMSGSGIKLLGVVSDAKPEENDGTWKDVTYLGKISDLEKIIQTQSADEVYIAIPEMPHRDILDLIVRCEKTGASFKIVSDLVSIVTAGAGLSPISGLPIVDFKEERHDWGRRITKRIIDIVLGTLLLLAVLPLGVLIAIVIHYTIPGSILIREERVGKNGRLFKMYRFRLNPPGRDTNEMPQSPFSRFLRRAFLEELPQILNVLRGEMSLVGPRPEVPEIVATYAAWQRKRLEVPPGVTGLWQIVTPGDRPLHENLEYDFFYIKNYDLWMDFSILLRTLPILIFGRKSQFP